MEAVMARFSAWRLRTIARHAALAELEGLKAEMELRSVREGGRVDLTLDDIAARIEQVRNLEKP